MKYKFVSMMEGDKDVECETFKEAFTAMYNWVMAHKEGLPFQVLETAIWIEGPLATVFYFYDARDRAIYEGIMKDGGGLVK